MNAAGKEIASKLRSSQRLLYCRCERAVGACGNLPPEIDIIALFAVGKEIASKLRSSHYFLTTS